MNASTSDLLWMQINKKITTIKRVQTRTMRETERAWSDILHFADHFLYNSLQLFCIQLKNNFYKLGSNVDFLLHFNNNKYLKPKERRKKKHSDWNTQTL